MNIIQNAFDAVNDGGEVILQYYKSKKDFIIQISDNGIGMTDEELQKAVDPFYTDGLKHEKRKVGLGLPLLYDACKTTGGRLLIESEENRGTTVTATLGLSHFDRQPMGDIVGVILLLVSGNPNIDFTFTSSKNGNRYVFSTKKVIEVLDGISINAPEVVKMLREMIVSNLEEL